MTEDTPSGVCVFGPSTVVTITIENDPAGNDDIHFHGGGQGFWVGRLIANLGLPTTLCTVFGGEPGRVAQALIDDTDIEVRAVGSSRPTPSYVHDRRDGERREVASATGAPLTRHEVDELYGATLTAGLEHGLCVLCGPADPSIVSADIYRRLATDLGSNGVTVIADLSGDHLLGACDGGAHIVKVSHEDLRRDGLLASFDLADIETTGHQLRARGAGTVLITRADAPLVAFIGGRILEVTGPKFEPKDHRGSGDALTATIAAALAWGLTPDDALRWGVAAGALTATRHGLGTADRREIHRLAGSVTVRDMGEPAGERETAAPQDLTAAMAEGAVAGTMTSTARVCALVTNDDGVDSPGLHALARAAVDAGLDVIVAAPASDSSGMSAGLIATEHEGTVIVERHEIPGLGGVVVYGIEAAPGFIALTGTRGAFGVRPDVVLSGINRGPNTGHAILHSGTVGAALTAAGQGCRAMAVSIEPGEDPQWATAASVARQFFDELLDAPEGTVFNVNVPDRTVDELRGVRRATLAAFGTVQTKVAELTAGHLTVSVSEPHDEHAPGTDAALLAAGWATITPLRGICEAADLPLSDGLTRPQGVNSR